MRLLIRLRLLAWMVIEDFVRATRVRNGCAVHLRRALIQVIPVAPPRPLRAGAPASRRPSHSRPRAPATWRIRARPFRHDDGSAQAPAGKHPQATRPMRTPADDQGQKGAAMTTESRHMQVRCGP